MYYTPYMEYYNNWIYFAADNNTSNSIMVKGSLAIGCNVRPRNPGQPAESAKTMHGNNNVMA